MDSNKTNKFIYGWIGSICPIFLSLHRLWKDSILLFIARHRLSEKYSLHSHTHTADQLTQSWAIILCTGCKRKSIDYMRLCRNRKRKSNDFALIIFFFFIFEMNIRDDFKWSNSFIFIHEKKSFFDGVSFILICQTGMKETSFSPKLIQLRVNWLSTQCQSRSKS